MKIKILISVLLINVLINNNSYANDDLSPLTEVGKFVYNLLNGECFRKDEKNVYRCSNEKGLYFKWKADDGEWKTSEFYPY